MQNLGLFLSFVKAKVDENGPMGAKYSIADQFLYIFHYLESLFRVNDDGT